jgi:hypothetical protein
VTRTPDLDDDLDDDEDLLDVAKEQRNVLKEIRFSVLGIFLLLLVIVWRLLSR